MMLKRILIVLFLVLIVFFNCKKKTAPDIKTKGIWYVIAETGLKIRETPDINGKVISLIPFGKDVELLEETGEVFEISGEKGRWSKVSWNGYTGWVFGGFLSAKPLDQYKESMFYGKWQASEGLYDLGSNHTAIYSYDEKNFCWMGTWSYSGQTIDFTGEYIDCAMSVSIEKGTVRFDIVKLEGDSMEVIISHSKSGVQNSGQSQILKKTMQ